VRIDMLYIFETDEKLLVCRFHTRKNLFVFLIMSDEILFI